MEATLGPYSHCSLLLGPDGPKRGVQGIDGLAGEGPRGERLDERSGLRPARELGANGLTRGLRPAEGAGPPVLIVGMHDRKTCTQTLAMRGNSSWPELSTSLRKLIAVCSF